MLSDNQVKKLAVFLAMKDEENDHEDHIQLSSNHKCSFLSSMTKLLLVLVVINIVWVSLIEPIKVIFDFYPEVFLVLYMILMIYPTYKLLAYIINKMIVYLSVSCNRKLLLSITISLLVILIILYFLNIKGILDIESTIALVLVASSFSLSALLLKREK